MNDIEERLRTFIREEILLGDPEPRLSDDTPLLNSVLDSMGVEHLISYLEQEFDLVIPEEDIRPEHFGSIGALAEMVRERTGLPVSPGAGSLEG